MRFKSLRAYTDFIQVRRLGISWSGYPSKSFGLLILVLTIFHDLTVAANNYALIMSWESGIVNKFFPGTTVFIS